METLLIPLSNALNGAFLLLIVISALMRLTSGKAVFYVEKMSLMLIAIGAFFQLAELQNPYGTQLDLLCLRFGTASFMLYHTVTFLFSWQPK
jgi:hypothetical protein